MTIANIANGESGADVRTKLNQIIAAVNNGGPYKVVTLNASDLINAEATSIEIVPAPGPGKAVIATMSLIVTHGGVYAFYKSTSPGGNVLRYATPFAIASEKLVAALQGTTGEVISVEPTLGFSALALVSIENVAIEFGGTGFANGAIASSAVANGGSGYAPGDTFVTFDWGVAQFTVDTVDGDGAVTAFSVSVADGEPGGTGLATETTSGAGAGLTIDLVVNQGDGSADVVVFYAIIDV